MEAANHVKDPRVGPKRSFLLAEQENPKGKVFFVSPRAERAELGLMGALPGVGRDLIQSPKCRTGAGGESLIENPKCRIWAERAV